MNKKVLIIIILVIIAGGFAFYLFSQPEEEPFEMTKTGNMKIESPVFENNQSIPSKYTCDGENISPPFKISQVPEGTKSLVLISDDPDAPMGTWVHWTIWNINPEIEEIVEASVPQGAIEGKTSFGKPGYGGPCPPSGTHRYFFRLYALGTTLELDSSAEVSDIMEAMKEHILEKAELMGLYKREQHSTNQKVLKEAIKIGVPDNELGDKWIHAHRNSDLKCPKNPRHKLSKETVAGRSVVYCPVHQK